MTRLNQIAILGLLMSMPAPARAATLTPPKPPKAPSQEIESVKFMKPDELPDHQRFKEYDRAVKSSVKFNDGLGQCSGTVTSDEGHLTTALHCVRACLELWQPEVINGVTRNRVLRDKLPRTCEVTVDGKKVTARLLSTGKGFLFPYPNQFVKDLTPKEMSKLLNEGYGQGGDYAILQIDGMKGHPCVPVERTAPKGKEKLWAIGYPGRTERPEGSNADGSSKYVSQGEVCGIQQNTSLQYAYSGLPVSQMERLMKGILEAMAGDDERLEKYRKKAVDFRALNYQRSAGIIPHSADLVPGNSGGGLFNEHGRLAGVNISVENVDEANRGALKKEMPGSSSSLSLQRIIQLAKEHLPADQVESFFSCR